MTITLPWTREQDLAVLYAKLEYSLQRFRTHPNVGRMAAAMERTEAAVVMRIGNFNSLDSSVPTGGLPNAARLTREIWDEYQRYPEQVFAEAREAYDKLLNGGYRDA